MKNVTEILKMQSQNKEQEEYVKRIAIPTGTLRTTNRRLFLPFNNLYHNGFSMPYFKDAKTYSYFINAVQEALKKGQKLSGNIIKTYENATKIAEDASKQMAYLEENGIYQIDCTIDNLMYDANGKAYTIDIDGCYVDKVGENLGTYMQAQTFSAESQTEISNFLTNLSLILGTDLMNEKYTRILEDYGLEAMIPEEIMRGEISDIWETLYNDRAQLGKISYTKIKRLEDPELNQKYTRKIKKYQKIVL